MRQRAFAIKEGRSEGELLSHAISSPFKGAAARVQKVLPGGSLTVTVMGDFIAPSLVLCDVW